jgi:hypothetical protein
LRRFQKDIEQLGQEEFRRLSDLAYYGARGRPEPRKYFLLHSQDLKQSLWLYISLEVSGEAHD